MLTVLGGAAARTSFHLEETFFPFEQKICPDGFRRGRWYHHVEVTEVTRPPRQGGPVFPSIENTMPKVAGPDVMNSETESQLLAQRVSSCAFLNGVGP